jgi:hypothetical protein
MNKATYKIPHPVPVATNAMGRRRKQLSHRRKQSPHLGIADHHRKKEEENERAAHKIVSF